MCSEEIMTPRRLQKKENYDGYQLQRDGLHNRLKSLEIAADLCRADVRLKMRVRVFK